MNPRYIISAPAINAGLGNRIKCLVSCMSISNQIEKSQLLLGWVQSANFNCQFHDLFDNEFFLYDDLKQQINQDDQPKKFINTWQLVSSLGELSFNPKVKASRPKRIDFKYHLIEPQIIQSFLEYFNQLKVKQTILDEVESFENKFDQNTISVALRTWAGCEQREHMFKIDNVYSILDRYPSAQFFVSCDSSQIVEQIQKRYDQQVLTYPLRTDRGERNSKEGIQDALIELLLLSKNSKLKASRVSTFSEVAWWFGGCKAEVELI